MNFSCQHTENEDFSLIAAKHVNDSLEREEESQSQGDKNTK